MSLLGVCALALSACGGEDGSPSGPDGESVAVDSPGDAVASYVAAMAAGEFETGLGLLAEAPAYAADGIVRVAADIPVEVEILNPADLEGASGDALVEYAWGESEFEVAVTETDDGWRLAEAAHLVAFDPSDSGQSALWEDLDHLANIGQVTVTTAAGEDATEMPQAVLVSPYSSATADDPEFLVEFTGMYGVPSQQLTGTLLSETELDTGLDGQESLSRLTEFDLGALEQTAIDLAESELGWRTSYVDPATGLVAFQYQPFETISDCEAWMRSGLGYTFEGFYMQCDATTAQTTVDGDTVVGNDGAPVQLKGAPAGCGVRELDERNTLFNNTTLTFQVLDGQMKALWEADQAVPGQETNQDIDGPFIFPEDEMKTVMGVDCAESPIDPEDVQSDGSVISQGVAPLTDPQLGVAPSVVLD